MKKIGFILGILFSFSFNTYANFLICDGKDHHNRYQYMYGITIRSGKVSQRLSSLTVYSKDEDKVYDLQCPYSPDTRGYHLCYDDNYTIKKPIYSLGWAEL